MNQDITFHVGEVRREDRESLLRQRGCVVWLTGLSGSGKSTISHALERALTELGKIAFVLDGDNLRHGLNEDLGFSEQDREENIRRVAEVAAMFVSSGLIVITSLISPYRAHRERARSRVPDGRFLEIFVDVPIDVCEARDPKGLYRRARAGLIASFTGISAPYEKPLHPDLHIRASEISIQESVTAILAMLNSRKLLDAPEEPTE